MSAASLPPGPLENGLSPAMDDELAANAIRTGRGRRSRRRAIAVAVAAILLAAMVIWLSVVSSHPFAS